MAQYPVGVAMLFQLIEPVKREESVAPIVIVPPGAMLLEEVLEALYASNPNAKTWEVKLPDWESACTRGTAPEDEIPCHPKPRRPEIVPVTIVWRISQAAKIWFLWKCGVDRVSQRSSRQNFEKGSLKTLTER